MPNPAPCLEEHRYLGEATAALIRQVRLTSRWRDCSLRGTWLPRRSGRRSWTVFVDHPPEARRRGHNTCPGSVIAIRKAGSVCAFRIRRRSPASGEAESRWRGLGVVCRFPAIAPTAPGAARAGIGHGHCAGDVSIRSTGKAVNWTSSLVKRDAGGVDGPARTRSGQCPAGADSVRPGSDTESPLFRAAAFQRLRPLLRDESRVGDGGPTQAVIHRGEKVATRPRACDRAVSVRCKSGHVRRSSRGLGRQPTAIGSSRRWERSNELPSCPTE